MAIIVEGFDNSGKSTLAASLGRPVVHPGPRPGPSEELDYLVEQLRTSVHPVTMDRVTAISQPCYGDIASLPFYLPYVRKMLDSYPCILIYCRPPTEVIKDFSNHVVKSYDDENKVRWLQDNADRIIANYDHVMAKIPHLRYDYTDPDPNVIELALNSSQSLGAWSDAKSYLRQPQRFR